MSSEWYARFVPCEPCECAVCGQGGIGGPACISLEQLDGAGDPASYSRICVNCLGSAIEQATGWKMGNVIAQFQRSRELSSEIRASRIRRPVGRPRKQAT